MQYLTDSAHDAMKTMHALCGHILYTLMTNNKQLIEPQLIKSSFKKRPSVLIPGLDLCVAQVEFGGQLHPVLDTEVLLSIEALLQSVELVIGEGRSSLSRLLRLSTASLSLARKVATLIVMTTRWRILFSICVRRKMLHNLKLSVLVGYKLILKACKCNVWYYYDF